MVEELKIDRYKNGEYKKVTDHLAAECLLQLSINTDLTLNMVLTPEKIRPFIYGHLFSKGFIKSSDEILEIAVHKYKNRIRAEVKLKNSLKDFKDKETQILWTGCASGGEPLGQAHLEKIKSSLQISAQKLITIPGKVRKNTPGFRLTGAYHYAFLFNKEANLLLQAKDIGRHNAVDKVIGEALLKDSALNGKILYTTGRISSDIVLKSLRAKIPLLISRSAPLAQAVKLAREYNLGVVGFLRGKRFNIYSGSEILT